MKICILSHEYPPFPGGGIATYHNAVARLLSEQGHQVHVVTNGAWFGATEPRLTATYWREGNLVIHRQHYFDEQKAVPSWTRFFDLAPGSYDGGGRWAFQASNLTALQAAQFVEALHGEVGFDVIESPEYFAESYYIIRRRLSGKRHLYPPVCLVGHTSTRFCLHFNQHVYDFGSPEFRYLMQREDYCLQHADALVTPSHSLMDLYRGQFQGRIPELNAVIPYPNVVGQNLDQIDTDRLVPPAALRGDHPYLLCSGRIEPRKGPDMALKAFCLLADDYPELRIAFLGRDAWRRGEPFERLIEHYVPEHQRSRVLMLGLVPWEEALGAVKHATAFLHPVPWDNYPCVTMEAMQLSAACVVSDYGGQAEMIEDGKSGLVFRSGDHRHLAEKLRIVLDDAALRKRVRRGARERIREIADEKRIIDAKIDFFLQVVEREKAHQVEPLGRFAMPAHLMPGKVLEPLPGAGLVLVDAAGTAADQIRATAESLRRQLGRSSEWRISALREPGEDLDLPVYWETTDSLSPAPWNDLPDDQVVVYLLPGTHFDDGALHSLVRLVLDSPVPCGGFLWVRPADVSSFPYRPDGSFHDLLLLGTRLPPVFAVQARHLRCCEGFVGLTSPQVRLCTLMALASLSGNLLFRHTGEVAGDFYRELPLVDEETQVRATGYLELVGLHPHPFNDWGRQDRERVVVQEAYHGSIPLRQLEIAYWEHQHLKNMKIVKLLKKTGVLSLLRIVFPKIKKAIGPG